LIAGGADKGLELDPLVKAISKYCKGVVLIPGSGTERLKENSKQQTAKIVEVKDLKESVQNTLKFATKGDVILFSPAFASFGMFNNEYERNDLFVKIIKGLK